MLFVFVCVVRVRALMCLLRGDCFCWRWCASFVGYVVVLVLLSFFWGGACRSL